MVSNLDTFPNAAQLAKEKRDFNSALHLAIERMNLRCKSVELAAQFPHSEPMKLAQQIYDFIREPDIA